MWLGLWQFIRGHVRVNITGFSVERFLNMAAFRGIFLWDVVRTDKGVHINVSTSGFKLLKDLGRKTGCRMRILKKNGLPFLIHRYRRRKLLVGGVLFFALALYALSSFIWRIDIYGSERLSDEVVLAFLDSQGLSIGTFKPQVDAQHLQRALLDHFADISWVNIHTRGTRTTIRLAEAIPPQPLVDRSTPAHIIAAKDGLIVNIVTGQGTPKVRQNDVVRQGDLLVSGIIEMQAETGPASAYVHAYAEIWARMYYQLEFSVPFVYTQKAYTGRVARRFHVQWLFGRQRRFSLPALTLRGTIPFNSYDRNTMRRQPGVGGDYPLPFIWIVDRYIEYTPEPRTRTLEEATEIAERALTERILRDFDFATDIIGKQLQFEQTPEALWVTALVTTHERIDQVVPITVPTPEIEQITN